MGAMNSDFKSVSRIGQTFLMNGLEINLKTWMEWAFLRAGGWVDVVPTNSATLYGGDLGVFRPVHDPAYADGIVWESARKDWCWETGVDHIDTASNTKNPISPATSITVDGSPTTPDHINYPLGRLIFSSAVPTSSTVKASYSYRYVQIYRANDVPWWKELQYRSFRQEDSHFAQLNDGSWAVGSQHRVQMPCIIIEATPRSISRPYQIGDGAAWVEQDVLCHVLAENRDDRNNILDIIRGQFDANIWLFDVDKVAAAGAAPLDYRGEIADSSKTYPALVNESTGYRWIRCRFTQVSIFDTTPLNSRLFQGIVRMTCEVIIED